MLSIVLVGVITLLQCGTPRQETTTTSSSVSASAEATADAPAQLPISAVTGPVSFAPAPNELIYVVDMAVTLKGGGRSQQSKTDILGRYHFYDVPPGKYTVCWEGTGWTSGCTPEVEVVAGQSAYPQPAELKPASASSVAWGTVRLADGSAATAVDRSSGTEDVPAVQVLDAAGSELAKGRANAAGQYAIGIGGVAAVVRVTTGVAREELRLNGVVAPPNAHAITIRNHRPAIASIDVLKNGTAAQSVAVGDTITLRPHVTDSDGDTLRYDWKAVAGTITSSADGTGTWQLPSIPALLTAYLTVSDGKGGVDRRAISLSAGAQPTPTGRQSISRPIFIPGVCVPMSLASVPPPNGYPPKPSFLTFMGTTDNSAAYYKNVDPQNLRSTLGSWWKVAGFNPSDGSGGVAKAAYLNWNDLGFGRDMHFNQVGNKVYAWVTNYGCPDNNPKNADLAAKPIPANAVATVCMEYSPVEGLMTPPFLKTQPIVKFFVYVGGVTNSPRTGQANLDEWGAKPVPNLCQVCHGNGPGYTGGTNVNLGSSFIPFDLALLRYPNSSVTPPPSDLAAYHTMNTIIANSTNPTAPIKNLVAGWYTPLLNPPAQNNNYLPAGWKASGSVPASAGALYQNVIVPGCRTCHYSFSSGISWDTYQTALSNRSFIRSYVCGKGPYMPHAAVTYIHFWTNAYGFPKSPPVFLGSYTDANWPSYGGCAGK